MLRPGSYYLLCEPYAGISPGLYRLKFEGISFILLQKNRRHSILVDRDIVPHLILLVSKKREAPSRASIREDENHDEDKLPLHMIYH